MLPSITLTQHNGSSVIGAQYMLKIAIFLNSFTNNHINLNFIASLR